jgi:hypothetical protein
LNGGLGWQIWRANKQFIFRLCQPVFLVANPGCFTVWKLAKIHGRNWVQFSLRANHQSADWTKLGEAGPEMGKKPQYVPLNQMGMWRVWIGNILAKKLATH